MNIDDAALATQKYFVTWHGDISHKIWQVFSGEGMDTVAVSQKFMSKEEAQVACDHMNLIAVLEAIREPSGKMEDNLLPSDLRQWRYIFDALIAEVIWKLKS